MRIFISPFQVKKELYLHMSLFGSNLVAIATILKAKFAAKVLLVIQLCKFIAQKIYFLCSTANLLHKIAQSNIINPAQFKKELLHLADSSLTYIVYALSEACFDEGVRQNSSSRGRITPKGIYAIRMVLRSTIIAVFIPPCKKKSLKNLRMCNFCCTFAR